MIIHIVKRARPLLIIARVGLSRDTSYRKQVAIIKSLIGLGGVYIKFAQLMLVRMSDRKGISQHDFSFLLKQTYDSTPLEPINAAAVVRAELGSLAGDLQDISIKPIASGSFGQVYRAQLAADGTDVIIKIVKPSVLRTIKNDLRILGLLTRIVNMSSTRAVDLGELFAELRHVILGELDYEAEAFNAAQLYDSYKEHPSLVIPKTYELLSTKHIIVQDYVCGLSLTDVIDHKSMGEDAAAYVMQQTGSSLIYQMTVVGQEMLAAMLRGGLTHGDPHPGNIILLEQNRIALIDFGICTEGPANKQAFFKLVKQYKKVYVENEFNIEAFTIAITELFADDLMGAIRSLDRYRSGEVSERVIEAIQDGVRTMYAGAGRDIEGLVQDHKFMQIFDSVVNENNRFGLSITIDQPAFIRATLLFISLNKSLGIKEDVLRNTYGNVVEAFQDYQFTNLAPPAASQEQAIAVIAEWLEQVASRDIFLYKLLSAKIGRGFLYV